MRMTRDEYDNRYGYYEHDEDGFDVEAANDAAAWEEFEDARKAYLAKVTAIQAKLGTESAKDLGYYIGGESDCYGDNVALRVEECFGHQNARANA